MESKENTIKMLGRDLHHLGVEVSPDILAKLVKLGWMKDRDWSIQVRVPPPLLKGNENLPIIIQHVRNAV